MAGKHFLILEKGERLLRIYQKLFQSKNYLVDFAVNESECFEKFKNASKDNYDYIVLEKSIKIDNLTIEDKIREVNPLQKILFLSNQMNEPNPNVPKEIFDMVEKPFAMVILLGKIDLEEHHPTIKVK